MKKMDLGKSKAVQTLMRFGARRTHIAYILVVIEALFRKIETSAFISKKAIITLES